MSVGTQLAIIEKHKNSSSEQAVGERQAETIKQLEATVERLRVHAEAAAERLRTDENPYAGVLDRVVKQTKEQSLAAIQAEAAKKAFWAGFEISRSFPDDHKIEWFWHEWAKTNYPVEHANQLRQQADKSLEENQ